MGNLYFLKLSPPLSGKSQTVTPTSVANARYLDKFSGGKNHSVLSTLWVNVCLVIKHQPTIWKKRKICSYVSSTAALRASPGGTRLPGWYLEGATDRQNNEHLTYVEASLWYGLNRRMKFSFLVLHCHCQCMSWVSNCLTAWLPDYLTTWLPDFHIENLKTAAFCRRLYKINKHCMA